MLGKHSTNTATLLLELFKFSISLTRVLEIHLPTPPGAGIEGMGHNHPAPRHSFKPENCSGGWWIYSILIRRFIDARLLLSHLLVYSATCLVDTWCIAFVRSNSTERNRVVHDQRWKQRQDIDPRLSPTKGPRSLG